MVLSAVELLGDGREQGDFDGIRLVGAAKRPAGIVSIICLAYFLPGKIIRPHHAHFMERIHQKRALQVFEIVRLPMNDIQNQLHFIGC